MDHSRRNFYVNILYDAIAQTALVDEARALIELSSLPAADPILGNPPEIVYRWNTFGKKHGALVERIMTKVIQSYLDWKPAAQTRFNCDTAATKTLIDRIAINRRSGVVIFIECKRNLKNVSGPYLTSINRYNNWCQSNSTNILKKLHLDPLKSTVYFVVFNAYGSSDDRRIVKGIPVLLPEDLPKVFGLPVLQAFEELNNVVQTVVSENKAIREFSALNDRPRRQPFSSDVASDIEVQETPEQFRYRIKTTLEQLTYR